MANKRRKGNEHKYKTYENIKHTKSRKLILSIYYIYSIYLQLLYLCGLICGLVIKFVTFIS